MSWNSAQDLYPEEQRRVVLQLEKSMGNVSSVGKVGDAYEIRPSLIAAIPWQKKVKNTERR
jgi:hypothetical protein